MNASRRPLKILLVLELNHVHTLFVTFTSPPYLPWRRISCRMCRAVLPAALALRQLRYTVHFLFHSFSQRLLRMAHAYITGFVTRSQQPKHHFDRQYCTRLLASFICRDRHRHVYLLPALRPDCMCLLRTLFVPFIIIKVPLHSCSKLHFVPAIPCLHTDTRMHACIGGVMRRDQQQASSVRAGCCCIWHIAVNMPQLPPTIAQPPQVAQTCQMLELCAVQYPHTSACDTYGTAIPVRASDVGNKYYLLTIRIIRIKKTCGHAGLP